MTTATEPRIVPTIRSEETPGFEGEVVLTLGRSHGQQRFINRHGQESAYPDPMTCRQANGAWSAWSTAVKDAAIDRARAEGLLP